MTIEQPTDRDSPPPRRRGRAFSITVPKIPLFERIIYYHLVPELFTRIVLELGLGLYWYILTQPKLWVFNGLMIIEYAIQTRSLVRSRFVVGPNLMVAGLLLVMLIHGLVIGFVWGNKVPKILTDTIPIMVVMLNVLLLSRVESFDGFSMDRVVRVIWIYGLTMIITGAVAVGIGRPSVISVGGAVGTPLCLTLLIVAMLQQPRIKLEHVLMLGVIVVPTLGGSTRTTALVFILIWMIFIMPKILRSGWATYTTAIIILLGGLMFPVLVPEDSPLMRRIQQTIEFASSEEEAKVGEGALGERAAEVVAIEAELDRRGPMAHAVGLGAGGIYPVEFTGGRPIENYSHAHYSWALFKLRFGYIGYFYLAIYWVLLLVNFWRNWRSSLPESRIIVFLNIWAFVFMFTYFYFNLLIAGLQFSESRRQVSSYAGAPRIRRPLPSSTRQVS
jgi:hypothetical protein